jgi:Lipid A core - O-antigen ligase and related enzymes
MAVSAIFSVEPRKSIIKLCGEIYLLSLPVLAFNLLRTREDLKNALQAWLAGSSVAVVIGLLTVFLFYFDRENALLRYTLHHFGAVPAGNYPRVASTFLSPSQLCNYLSVSLIILLTARFSDWIKNRLFYVLLAAILLVAIFTIASNLGGLAFAAGLWIYFVYRKRQKIFARAGLFFGTAAAILFYAINFIALQKHSTATYSFSIFGREFQPSPRLMIWAESLQTFKENFLFGRGVGTDACRVLFENTDGSFSLLTDAHNTFLSVAAQEGIFGLAAITAICVYVLRKTLSAGGGNNQTNLLKISFGAAFASAFVYQGLTSSFEDARHLWVLIGLILAVENSSEYEN